MKEKEKQTFLIAMPEISCYGKQFPAWELGDNTTLSAIRKVLNEISLLSPMSRRWYMGNG